MQIQKLQYGNAREIDKNFDNNINLSNYEGQDIKRILDQLKGIVVNNLNKSKEKINTKLLGKVLNWVDKKENEINRQVEDEEKTKISRFNNQFEFYVGENLEYENMTRLLEVVGKNFKDYNVVNGNQINILIEEGAQNSERFTEMSNQIQDKYKYNVKMNYNGNGIIESIDITVAVEKN